MDVKLNNFGYADDYFLWLVRNYLTTARGRMAGLPLFAS